LYCNLLLCFIPLEMHVRLLCAIKFYLLTYLRRTSSGGTKRPRLRETGSSATDDIITNRKWPDNDLTFLLTPLCLTDADNKLSWSRTHDCRSYTYANLTHSIGAQQCSHDDFKGAAQQWPGGLYTSVLVGQQRGAMTGARVACKVVVCSGPATAWHGAAELWNSARHATAAHRSTALQRALARFDLCRVVNLPLVWPTLAM